MARYSFRLEYPNIFVEQTQGVYTASLLLARTRVRGGEDGGEDGRRVWS